MERINLVELLKDCIGMELDCAVLNNVTLYRIDTSPENDYPIRIETKNGKFLDLTKYGAYLNIEEARCVIFPKGKTTWEGFVPPCEFKDGDIITCTNSVCTFTSIFKEKRTIGPRFTRYCALILDKNKFDVGIYESDFKNPRLATKKEKQKLFRAIKNNGYKWNPKTKTLKLIKPEFHERDWVVKGDTIAQILDIQERYYAGLDINGKDFTSSRFLNGDKIHLWTIQDAKDGDVLAAHECLVLFKKLDGPNIKCYCTYHFMNNPRFYIDTLQNKNVFHPATEEEKQKLFDAITENDYKWNSETKTLEKLPKFKVGDRVRHKDDKNVVITITGIKDDYYIITFPDSFGNAYITDKLLFKNQNEYELFNKFDITTLKPFKSRVLMRSSNASEWTGTIFSHYSNNKFYGCGMCCDQCIPYEGNEHLLGKKDDCNEFYRTTWEKTGD